MCLISAASWAQNAYQVRPTVTTCINVRTEPSTDAEIVDCLVANEKVVVVDSAPFWRRVELENQQDGWIAKKFIIPDDTVVSRESDLVMEVHFIDVGQGDGIWIHTADDGIDGNGEFEGLNIVIDGGLESSDTHNAMLHYLKERAHHLAVLDVLIVTHPHTDHYRGAEGLTRHFEVEQYYDPGMPVNKVGYNAFIDSFSKPDHHVANVDRGPSIVGELDWGDELDVEIINSWSGSNTGMGHDEGTRINNSSVVLKVTYGDQTFLFMGDAEGKERADSPGTPKYAEKKILDSGVDIGATVLKIAHHGSETSSTLPFIEAVNPTIVVVQSGRKCYSGRHIPDITTLQRYCDNNSETLFHRTDHGDEALHKHRAYINGDHIVVRTDGNTVQVDGQETDCGSLPDPAPMPHCS